MQTEALEDLFLDVIRFVRRKFGLSPDDAQDLVSDAYVRLLEKKKYELSDGIRLRKLLFAASRNAAIDLLRKRREPPEEVEALPAPALPLTEFRDFIDDLGKWELIELLHWQLDATIEERAVVRGIRPASIGRTRRRVVEKWRDFLAKLKERQPEGLGAHVGYFEDHPRGTR